MAKKFGTTWWGKQWLDSLEGIDYSNRLPRGARYARNGSVKSIDISDGSISARVWGSAPSPYKEVITIPEFDKAKVKKFVDSLTAQPMILAALMQRRLDPEVLNIAEQSGLKVFPSSWKDLGMKCSCPDWAVPCKHLAAVIYKVSEEIDNNPFLVFELHGLDLLAELKKRGMLSEATAENINPIKIGDLLHKVSHRPQECIWKAPEIDMSKLPAIGDDLLELLTDNPPFSIAGDFKKEYAKKLSGVGRSMTRSMAAAMPGNDEMIVFEPGTEIEFGLSQSYEVRVKLIMPSGKTVDIEFSEFVNRLSNVSVSSYLTSEPWLETMHRMWLFAAKLISRQDIVPLIVSVGDSFRILWQPAMMQPDIKRAVEEVTDCVPPVVKCDAKSTWLENSGEWLLWNMLTAMITASCAVTYNDNELTHFFFHDTTDRFNKIGQHGIPGGIKVWTDRFFILNDDATRFEIQVDDNDDEFEVSIFVSVAAGSKWLAERLRYSDFINNKSLNEYQLGVLIKLSSLADYMPGLREYLIEKGAEPMTFNTQSFVPFLLKTLPLMRLLGVEIALPKSLHELITPKVSVKIGSKKSNDGKSYLRLDELLDFNWEIALGDTLVSIEEFKRIMKNAGELIKFRGRYLYVTPEQLSKLWKELSKGTKLSSQEILAIALAEKYNEAPVVLTESCRKLLEEFRNMPQTPVPTGLQAELRPYQQRGYEWMMHNISLGFGSIIADDMGLGKTLQVIAVLLQLKESGRLDKHKALVVVPTGLLTNWQKECSRFAPSLNIGVYHGAARSLDGFDSDIMLTSYGVVRSDATKLKKLRWEIVVIDEAQNIKNIATAQTKAINSISAANHIAMSGTPVENRLSEYWSIMNFTNKGLFGSLKEFNAQYSRPIQLEGNKEVIERFKAITAPFMLRRLKSDKSIISDLPDKIERDEFASLTPDQSALYEQTLNAAMNEIEGVEGTDHASLLKRQGLVLQMIMALKQICNHPAQFLKTNQADADLSGKAQMLIDLVKAIVESGEKVLIFTQFKEMGELIVKMLEKADIQSMFYHGGCTLKKRTEMVERFQSVRSAQVFVLSLKAAGTGLNLTEATNVIHFDLWWNPAVEAQATDRAYRIGQHRNVQVYRFITKGTFEEKINAMIQDKKQLAELTVGSGEKWLASMSDSELRSIFALDSKK